MSSPGSGPFPAGNFTFRRHHILMGCIELFVVDLALSKDFVIRCDKLMLIIFILFIYNFFPFWP